MGLIQPFLALMTSWLAVSWAMGWTEQERDQGGPNVIGAGGTCAFAHVHSMLSQFRCVLGQRRPLRLLPLHHPLFPPSHPVFWPLHPNGGGGLTHTSPCCLYPASFCCSCPWLVSSHLSLNVTSPLTPMMPSPPLQHSTVCNDRFACVGPQQVSQ